MRLSLVRRTRENCLRQSFYLVSLLEEFLPVLVLMRCLLSHSLEGQPEAERNHQHVKAKHDEGPKRKIRFHPVSALLETCKVVILSCSMAEVKNLT